MPVRRKWARSAPGDEKDKTTKAVGYIRAGLENQGEDDRSSIEEQLTLQAESVKIGQNSSVCCTEMSL